MNPLLLLVIAGALVAAPAFGADTKPADAKAANPQQEKMKACNEQAGDKKGDERKAFMKSCLSASPAPAKPESRMAMCNRKTAGLSGDARAKAQSECMKGS